MIGKFKNGLFLVVFMVLYGCSPSPDMITSQNSPTTDINTIDESLDVVYLIGPDVRASKHLSVVIENNSEYCLVFPYDFGVRLWARVNGNWDEVDNISQYSPMEDIILDPKGSAYSVMEVSLKPDLTDIPIVEQTDFIAELNAHLCDDPAVEIKKEIPFTISP